MGGDCCRCARIRPADHAGRGAVRGHRCRDHRQRAVSRPRARRRAVQIERPAVLFRHARRLPRADQPLCEKAPSHRPVDADRCARVPRRTPGLPAIRTGRRADRAQPRCLRQLAGGSRPGKPADASDHRHVGAREARAGPAQGTDARTGEAGRGVEPRRHSGPRCPGRRSRHRHGLSRPGRSRPPDVWLDDGRRDPGGAPAPGRRPDRG